MSRTCLSLAALAITLIAAPTSAVAQERRYVDPTMARDTTTLPFSGGVLVGRTLYLAGNIGLLPGPKVPATASEEARVLLDSVKAVLARAEMTMDDLVSVQVFCSDLSAYADFNRVYATYFTREYPARAFVGVANLLFGARFELKGVAVRR